MTAPRISEGATVTVAGGSSPIAVSEFVSIAITAQNTPTNISQLAIISVIANGKNFLPLGPVLPLPCWQPCTAYGTRAIVIRFN